jgi:uncharacterized protein YcbX
MSVVVDKLVIYPLKSGGGIEVDSIACTPRGPALDRRWMVVDENGKFLSQRTAPRLAQVAVRLTDRGIAALFGDHEIDLDAPDRTGDTPVEVWNSNVQSCDLGDDVAEAFSGFLGQDARVVYMSDRVKRYANPRRTGPDQLVSFADGYPYLLSNVGSLTDLEARVGASLEMARFRPNIVVRGAPAWAEDNWSAVRIADATFDLVKPCGRCTMTTLDPETGVRTGPEPLRTLATFRRDESGEVNFGWNAVGPSSGTIRVGDPVVGVPRG